MQHIGTSLNVVHLYEVFEDDTHIHLVLELCRGGVRVIGPEGVLFVLDLKRASYYCFPYVVRFGHSVNGENRSQKRRYPQGTICFQSQQ